MTTIETLITLTIKKPLNEYDKKDTLLEFVEKMQEYIYRGNMKEHSNLVVELYFKFIRKWCNKKQTDWLLSEEHLKKLSYSETTEQIDSMRILIKYEFQDIN